MSQKLNFTAALIALGIVSSASAVTTNEVHVTGSTAFRANFFSAATGSPGIFDAPGGTALPAGANNASSVLTFVGNINGVPYALECSWTGSEAGIANVDNVGSLPNPGLPNNFQGAAAIPGATTTFPKIDGTSGGFTGAGDISMADTSQAVSLTRPPAHPNLISYGVPAIVTFTYEKSANSTGSLTSADAGDAAWARCTNITHYQAVIALGSTVNANFITGDVADNGIPVLMFGRNAGSGTRVNTLGDLFYGITTGVTQFALNSKYNGSGVLTYQIVANNQAASYPTVAACEANQTDATTIPNLLGIGNDGYDSGGGVSDCMSCDATGSEVLNIGYLGISDAKHARDGNSNSGTVPNQPGGAVFLTLDGTLYNDASVVNGSYTFWGHEHVYGNLNNGTIQNIAATNIIRGIENSGLGTGSATAQSGGILPSSMLVDRPGGADVGYVTPL